MVIQKRLNELTHQELLQIFELRQKVFMIEQNIHEVDIDEFDEKALHCFVKKDGRIVSYARLIYHHDQLYIGRVCTDILYRKHGYTKAIMESLMEQYEVLAVSAQLPVIPFYRKLGFNLVGNKYKEAGIWHQKMVWIK